MVPDARLGSIVDDGKVSILPVFVPPPAGSVGKGESIAKRSIGGHSPTMVETIASTALCQHKTICDAVLHVHHPVGIPNEKNGRSSIG